MNKLGKIIAILILCIITVVGFQAGRRFFLGGSRDILIKSWEGYKKFFITWDGMVMRKEDNSAVSEGQALAMLRAVWMNDKETFKDLYSWTEKNLARSGLHAGMRDHLLAWKWQDGEIIDDVPYVGADLDYALALILASRRWPDMRPPVGLLRFEEKAKFVLGDILKKCTYRTLTGRLYLAPSMIDQKGVTEKYPVNPSNYSPAHFKIFFEVTENQEWFELAETAYLLLGKLADGTKNTGSIGLFPDFCSVNDKDEIEILESKSFDFGWEAVRIPYHLFLDYHWFKNMEAAQVLKGYASFFRSQWHENNGVIYCQYTHSGDVMEKYEDAMFYGSYYLAFKMLGYPEADELLEKLRSKMKRIDERYIMWENEYAYLSDGLVYMAEGSLARAIRYKY